MGAPLGNQNRFKPRDWEDALRQELMMFEDKERGIERKKALRAIARVVILKALDGDPTAYKEIGDRIDGKAHQSVDSVSQVNINVASEDHAILNRFGINVEQEAVH